MMEPEDQDLHTNILNDVKGMLNKILYIAIVKRTIKEVVVII